jgi:uncharacterized membrane protein
MSVFYVGGMLILILGNAAQAMKKVGNQFMEWLQMFVYAGVIVVYMILLRESSTRISLQLFQLITFLVFLGLYTAEIVMFTNKVIKDEQRTIWDVVMLLLSATPVIFQFAFLI